MRKFLFLICLTTIGVQAISQTSKDSTDLVKRLEIFMQHNADLNFEKLMDYIYPKIFTLAPREQMKKSMESAFNSEEMGLQMDSLKIVKVFPLFSEGNSLYARVTYSLLIMMTPKQTDDDSLKKSEFLTQMKGQFGEENVRLDKTGKTLLIFQQKDLAAIKDELSPEWTFLTISKDDPIAEMVLNKELIARFYPD